MVATPTNNAIALTGTEIDGILQGSAWVDIVPVVLTYAVYVDAPLDPLGGGPWRDVQVENLRGVFDSISAVANITFQQITPDGTDFFTANADMAIVHVGDGGGSLLGLAAFPDPTYMDASFLPSIGQDRTTYANPEGDVYLFDDTKPIFNNMSAGGFDFAVALHEIGHALGLKHPHDDGGNGRPLISPLGLDSGFWTVMSYQDPQIITSTALFDLTRGYQSTPMPLDILAYQAMYGANFNYHTGNDTYLLKQDGQVRTIWDAGGIDTISAAALPGSKTTPLVINLNQPDISAPNLLPNEVIDHGDGLSYTMMSFYVSDGFGIVNYIENAIGTSLRDILIGNETDNSLDGRGGADDMTGGLGDDTFFVDNLLDNVFENPGEGTDTVISKFSFDLTVNANIEHLTLIGSGKTNGVGNGFDNIMTGNGSTNTLTGLLGNDTLDGGGGADVLVGGDGDDVYVVDNAKDVVTELAGEGTDTVFTKIKMILADEVENMTLLSDKGFAMTGNALNNVLTGSKLKNEMSGLLGDDTLIGLGGNDILDGGAGDDDMDGGLGDDIFFVDSALDVVREAAFEGKDIVFSVVSFSIAGPASVGVENITLMKGAGNIDATGNALNNILTGNEGNNVLDGGLGADVLRGGKGDDTYIIDNQGDQIVESGGIDTVITDIAYTFGPLNFMTVGIENLTFTGALDLNMLGNSGVNVITGNTGMNTLNGAGGNDTLFGGDGNDFLIGGTGNDLLSGDNNDDILVGGAGNDTLTGGAGIDTFLYQQASGSQTGVDTITDFAAGPGGDIIDIADILSNYSGTVTDYVQMVDDGSGNTIVRVDTNGLVGGVNFVQIAVLSGIVLTDEAQLVTDGNLVVT